MGRERTGGTRPQTFYGPLYVPHLMLSMELLSFSGYSVAQFHGSRFIHMGKPADSGTHVRPSWQRRFRPVLSSYSERSALVSLLLCATGSLASDRVSADRVLVSVHVSILSALDVWTWFCSELMHDVNFILVLSWLRGVILGLGFSLGWICARLTVTLSLSVLLLSVFIPPSCPRLPSLS